jgi:ABC-type sugar transport system ATPase subunit
MEDTFESDASLPSNEDWLVNCSAIHKTLGSRTILSNLCLKISRHEKLAVLGVSGSGKSTLLRLIAGLDQPTSGEVKFVVSPTGFDGPATPQVRMVFQRLSVYPHMTVGENLAFPLEITGQPRSQIGARVRQLAELLGLDLLLGQQAALLSGGEAQRLAIGKALANPPQLLLLDEPFSNLDQSLRWRLLEELKALHSQMRLTTVFVTHDCTEAFYFADRIAVLSSGRIVQVATPSELLALPRTLQVAKLIYNPQPNVLRGRISALSSQKYQLMIEGIGSSLEITASPNVCLPEELIVLWRPQDSRLENLGGDLVEPATSQKSLVLRGRIAGSGYFDDLLLVSLDCNGTRLTARGSPSAATAYEARISVPLDKVSFFDPLSDDRVAAVAGGELGHL